VITSYTWAGKCVLYLCVTAGCGTVGVELFFLSRGGAFIGEVGFGFSLIFRGILHWA